MSSHTLRHHHRADRSLMQKRSHPLCRQVQSLLRETQPYSIGQLRPAVSTVFSVPVRMDGPVFRVFLEPPMMNPAALTKSFCSSSKTVWPVARPLCRVSEFHICMAVSGYLIGPMRWELAMNSMLGHTS